MSLNQTLENVKIASRKLLIYSNNEINKSLSRLADELIRNIDEILSENQKDLDLLDRKDPIYDRVLLNESRIKDLANSVREIACYKSPIGEIIEEKVLENDLNLKKIRTPLGVIGVIFEARPNVVVDIFALCFKSKNACVLKGGSQSAYSNSVLVKIIKNVLNDKDIIELLPNDRELISKFLKAANFVDVIVPRGGKGLIDFVRKNSLIPVIETGAGVVHTYFDESGDIVKGREIIFNAKTDRPSVCNALDTLIIHFSRVNDLPELCNKLIDKEVEIRADNRSYDVLKGNFPDELLFKADEEDFGQEYLSLKMSLKTVSSLDEAIEHITKYGSMHSEAIITENKENAEKFLNLIDAAAVYVNASTRFTDGGVFGLGAEVGISTQKLHARGPMGIKELTSYKWQIIGNGQVR